jgi:hypothetical protein
LFKLTDHNLLLRIAERDEMMMSAPPQCCK